MSIPWYVFDGLLIRLTWVNYRQGILKINRGPMVNMCSGPVVTCLVMNYRIYKPSPPGILNDCQKSMIIKSCIYDQLNYCVFLQWSLEFMIKDSCFLLGPMTQPVASGLLRFPGDASGLAGAVLLCRCHRPLAPKNGGFDQPFFGPQKWRPFLQSETGSRKYKTP